MSRVSLIEQLYVKKKSALEFNYDSLWAPPISAFFLESDIQELINIVKSVKLNADVDKKRELINAIMNRRGFRFAHAGTNRLVYNCLEVPTIVAKVAIDRVGMKDTPKEFMNQEYFKPFCCKIFEVHPSGVIGFVEKVNPITSIEEFASVADDIFNLIVTKIIGKYVLDDIGANKFMNYGLRSNGYAFGPVILDYPYAYELDGAKLKCNRKINTPYGPCICNGDIDYNETFDFLVCDKCGKTYKARDLETKNKNILILNDEKESTEMATRSKIYIGGKLVVDTALSSKTYVSKEQFNTLVNGVDMSGDIPIDKVIHLRKPSKQEKKEKMHQEYEMQRLNTSQNQNVTKSILLNVDTKELNAKLKVKKSADRKLSMDVNNIYHHKNQQINEETTVNTEPVIEENADTGNGVITESIASAVKEVIDEVVENKNEDVSCVETASEEVVVIEEADNAESELNESEKEDETEYDENKLYLDKLVNALEIKFNELGILEHIVEPGDNEEAALYITIPDNAFPVECAILDEDITWNHNDIELDVEYISDKVLKLIEEAQNSIKTNDDEEVERHTFENTFSDFDGNTLAVIPVDDQNEEKSSEEIDMSGISNLMNGSINDEEPDYSNYVPEEDDNKESETDMEDDYDDTVDYESYTKIRNTKRQKPSSFDDDSDMEKY